MGIVIRGARIVRPGEVAGGDLRIERGRIADMGRLRPRADDQVIDASGLYALPGLIDLHTHGGGGFDATIGSYDAKRKLFDNSAAAYRHSLPKLMRRLARRGVTRALLATFAVPPEELESALANVADYVESPMNGVEGTRLEGLFLEGTFIKRPENAGAQNPENFRRPERALFDRLNRAARGAIRYVNVVPEYGAPAERLIRYLAERGILVGLGHSSCPAERVHRCVDLGLRVAVHFLNGPTGLLFKPFRGGNVKEAVLRNRRLYAEIIADGWHVAPAYVMDVIRRKGHKRVVAVTDAMFAAGARGVREFTAGGVEGEVHIDGHYMHTKHDPQTLFGSLLDMRAAFGNLLSWLTADMEGVWYERHDALALDTALIRVARMCSTNAAALLGQDKRRGGTGRLQVGKRADIVLASLKGEPGCWRIEVARTFVEGRRVA